MVIFQPWMDGSSSGKKQNNLENVCFQTICIIKAPIVQNAVFFWVWMIVAFSTCSKSDKTITLSHVNIVLTILYSGGVTPHVNRQGGHWQKKIILVIPKNTWILWKILIVAKICATEGMGFAVPSAEQRYAISRLPPPPWVVAIRNPADWTSSSSCTVL